MTRDIAPWDPPFASLYRGVIDTALAEANVGRDSHICLPLQGAGHFGIEAMVRAFVGQSGRPGAGRLLVPLTGAYGGRIVRLSREAGIDVVPLPVTDGARVDPASVAEALAADPGLTHVGLVYSETSTGIVHDVVAVGEVARAAGRTLLLDAVSAFGALPLDLAAMPEVAAMVFTSNKCFEGMPGLSFATCRLDALETAHPSGSWSLDLGDIWRLSRTRSEGFFRFTPPAQVFAAFAVAQAEHAAEGGRAGRLTRYRANRDALLDGMEAIGLTPYLPRDLQGPIVVNVCAPADPAWVLLDFVNGLRARGFIISNFHDTAAPSFRVGCIGAVEPDDLRRFAAAADATLSAMGVRVRTPALREEALREEGPREGTPRERVLNEREPTERALTERAA